MVSRQWLAEALPIFLRGNHLDIDGEASLHDFVKSHALIRANIRSVILLYPFRASTPPRIARLVNSCPKLRDVTLRWHPSGIELSLLQKDAKAGRDMKISALSAAASDEISRLRGMERLAMHVIGLADVARELEERFREVVSQPRDARDAEQVGVSL